MQTSKRFMMNRDLFEKHLDDLAASIINSTHKELYLRVNSDAALTHSYLNIDQFKEIWLSVFHAKEDLQLNNIPSINGLEITNIAHETGKKGTRIGKEGSHDEKVYHHFLCHLTDELSELNQASHARRKLQHLLHTWQEFFKGNSKPLGEQTQLGLMGELTVLQDCVLNQLNPKNALKAWAGPLRGLHDFVFKSCNIEVKSSIGVNNRHFIINGENQLTIPLEKHLYIMNPVFDISDNGQSLSDMVTSIKALVSSDQISLDIIENLLAKAGYHAIHSEYYLNEGLKLFPSAIITYRVSDGFPRLLPGSSGDFISVNDYAIDTKGCEDFLHIEEIRLD